MWEAADILNFYGTLLGSIVSVGILAITIWYNRKQIVSEKTFQIEQEKWLGIEKLVDQALDDIHPAKINKAIVEATENRRMDLFYVKLYLYQTTAQDSVDKLLLLSVGKENSDFTKLVNGVDDTMQKLNQIVSRYNSFLFNMWKNNMILEAAKEGNAIPELTWTLEMQYASDFVEQSNDISNQLAEIHKNSYQPLLSLKRNVFDQIKQQLLTSI